jgi:hypothetical protein
MYDFAPLIFSLKKKNCLSVLKISVSSVVVQDPHQIERLDPDQSNKLDPDPHKFADDKPKCMEYEPI